MPVPAAPAETLERCILVFMPENRESLGFEQPAGCVPRLGGRWQFWCHRQQRPPREVRSLTMADDSLAGLAQPRIVEQLLPDWCLVERMKPCTELFRALGIEPCESGFPALEVGRV